MAEKSVKGGNMNNKFILSLTIGLGLLLLGIQAFQDHYLSDSGLAFAQVEEPEDAAIAENEEPAAEEIKEPVKLPERAPTLSAETFRMLQTIERKNRDLKRREEEYQVREQHLKALEKKIHADLRKIDEALARSQEQLGVQQELVKKNIASLTKAYSSMKPEKAAEILEAIDENLALQIIAGMKSKVAGKVLSRLKIRVAKNISEKLAGRRIDPPPQKRRK